MVIAKFCVLLGVHCNKVKVNPKPSGIIGVNYREASPNTWQGSTRVADPDPDSIG
jgi:hypothetical protein